MNNQPQLLNLSLNPRDVVYTPDDVARDVVNFFKPTGRILEPSAGDGAFLRHLPPDTDWCEIEKGRDFFACHEHYDWIIGNPPYSIFSDFMRHAFEVADNICFLIPINKAFNSDKMMREIANYGGIRTIYVIGGGRRLGLRLASLQVRFTFSAATRAGRSHTFAEFSTISPIFAMVSDAK